MGSGVPANTTKHNQTQRWIQAGCFEDIVDDLRELLRVAVGKDKQPSAVIYDGQTLPGSIESGERSGYDVYKRKKGSKIHLAMDTLGNLLALVVTDVNARNASGDTALLTAASGL